MRRPLQGPELGRGHPAGLERRAPRGGDLEAAEREARAAIAVAKERVLARARTLHDPELRRGFLENVAENVRTIELAAAWG